MIGGVDKSAPLRILDLVSGTWCGAFWKHSLVSGLCSWAWWLHLVIELSNWDSAGGVRD
jgi:hypothetical protein